MAARATARSRHRCRATEGRGACGRRAPSVSTPSRRRDRRPHAPPRPGPGLERPGPRARCARGRDHQPQLTWSTSTANASCCASPARTRTCSASTVSVERAANEQAAGLGIAPAGPRVPRARGLPRHPLRRGRGRSRSTRCGSPPTSRASPRPSAPSTLPRDRRRLRLLPDPREQRPYRGGAGRDRAPEYDRAIEVAHRIEQAFVASPEPPVPCHNDLLNANFLLDRPAIDGPGRGMWLLDWEYAGMNDRWFDLGNFATNNELDDAAEHALLVAYFGAASDRRWARLALMKVMSDLREAMWGVVQQGISTLDFDYVDYADRHFDRLLAQRRGARVRRSARRRGPARGPGGARACVTGPRSSSSAPVWAGRASRGTSPSAAGPTCSCSSGPNRPAAARSIRPDSSASSARRCR